MLSTLSCRCRSNPDNVARKATVIVRERRRKANHIVLVIRNFGLFVFQADHSLVRVILVVVRREHCFVALFGSAMHICALDVANVAWNDCLPFWHPIVIHSDVLETGHGLLLSPFVLVFIV
jgi:hypothetical protein